MSKKLLCHTFCVQIDHAGYSEYKSFTGSSQKDIANQMYEFVNQSLVPGENLHVSVFSIVKEYNVNNQLEGGGKE